MKKTRVAGLILWRGGLLLAGGTVAYWALRGILTITDPVLELAVAVLLTGVLFVFLSVAVEQVADSREKERSDRDMNRLLRIVGLGLMLLGAVLVLIWMIRPLRVIWPWVRGLSLPIQLGLLATALGLAVLFASLIAERIAEREADRKLLDDV